VTYDPVAYWTERGKGYETEAVEQGWVDVENEPVFDLLDTLRFSSVLEAGCGFGRVGAAILKHYPGVGYTGFDVSPDLVEGARTRIPKGKGHLFVADLATWTPDRTWELVIAVSVLGHIRREDIRRVIRNLLAASRGSVVHVDWNKVGGETAFQYGHDYAAIYRELGITPARTHYGKQDIWYVRATDARVEPWQDAFG
jgi:trans-aconitate methyltransferase